MLIEPHPWSSWSILGSSLILFTTYFQVQVSVIINQWFGPFYDLIQAAVSKSRPVSIEEFNGYLVTFLSIALVAVVVGVLTTGTYGWITAKKSLTIGSWTLVSQGGVAPVWLFLVIGAVFLTMFFVHVRSRERKGRTPLVSPRLFANKTSNLGLTTQSLQWLVLLGTSFVLSVYLQQGRGFDAIQTGLTLLPATVGILLASALAQRMAGRHSQRRLIRAGFSGTAVGLALLLLLVRKTKGAGGAHAIME